MIKNEIPNVIQYNAGMSGCGFWRLLWPQIIINMKAKAQIFHCNFYIKDILNYMSSDVVHIQGFGKNSHYKFFKTICNMKKRINFRLIYDIDDVIFAEDIPDCLTKTKQYEKDLNVSYYTKKIIELCDELTVSTSFLKDYYLKKAGGCKNISVIENYPPMFWFGNNYSEEFLIHNYDRYKKRPRILYSGSNSHFSEDLGLDDFSHIIKNIIETRKEFKWIFVGCYPKVLEPYIFCKDIEFYDWKSLFDYPKLLSSLSSNMMIAPLCNNVFNKGKSDLKFLEASTLGLPVACQDLCTYKIAPIRFNTGDEMIEKIRKTLKTKNSFIEASREGRRLIENRWLENEGNIGKYIDVYSFPYGDSRRKHI